MFYEDDCLAFRLRHLQALLKSQMREEALDWALTSLLYAPDHVMAQMVLIELTGRVLQ